MTLITIFVLLLILVLIMGVIFRAKPHDQHLIHRMHVTTNAISKLKENITMFRTGISTEKLQRGSDANSLQYYIGYIAALAQNIALSDGIPPDGVILSAVQIEASRLLGTHSEQEGDYAEGVEILSEILATEAGKHGLQDGDIDGRYVVNRNNPGPYFGKLRARFEVKISDP